MKTHSRNHNKILVVNEGLRPWISMPFKNFKFEIYLDINEYLTSAEKDLKNRHFDIFRLLTLLKSPKIRIRLYLINGESTQPTKQWSSSGAYAECNKRYFLDFIQIDYDLNAFDNIHVLSLNNFICVTNQTYHFISV